MKHKILIRESQRGLLYKNGKYIKLLPPGKYYEYGGREIEVVELSQPLHSKLCPLETLLSDEELRKSLTVAEVADEQLGLLYVNGKFSTVLRPGKYAFWSVMDRYTVTMADTSTPEVSSEIPTYIFAKIPGIYYTKVEVAEYQKARLYLDRKFVRILDAGTYYFWKTGVRVDVDTVDTRLTQMNICGQEILTKDKVSLRISFVCSYRITDYVRILTEIDDFAEQLRVAAQLALREYVGRYKLDEILESKDQMSEFVLARLREKEKDLFVQIVDAGVKDLILPGEIRQIMNTVLVAEKKAQANVIARREEVASTRSLLNTAKLMEENQTLYKLKELEYMERICANVGNINLNGNGDALQQLATLLRGSQ